MGQRGRDDGCHQHAICVVICGEVEVNVGGSEEKFSGRRKSGRRRQRQDQQNEAQQAGVRSAWLQEEWQ